MSGFWLKSIQSLVWKDSAYHNFLCIALLFVFFFFASFLLCLFVNNFNYLINFLKKWIHLNNKALNGDQILLLLQNLGKDSVNV